MYEYLRSIGFARYMGRNSAIRKLLEILWCRPENKVRKEYLQNGDVLYEKYVRVGTNIGIRFIGEMAEIEGFSMEAFYPYAYTQDMSIYSRLEIYKLLGNKKYICETKGKDLKDMIFFNLDNVIDSLVLGKRGFKAAQIYFSAFSIKGKIILGIQKSKLQEQKQKKMKQEHLENVYAASLGDEKACEILMMEEIDQYSMLMKRMRFEDFYSIVESSLFPIGLEPDTYRLIGNILSVEKSINIFTREEVYDLLVSYNDIKIHLFINAYDLIGEPKVGRRFKGEVWLTGRCEWKEFQEEN